MNVVEKVAPSDASKPTPWLEKIPAPVVLLGVLVGGIEMAMYNMEPTYWFRVSWDIGLGTIAGLFGFSLRKKLGDGLVLGAIFCFLWIFWADRATLDKLSHPEITNGVPQVIATNLRLKYTAGSPTPEKLEQHNIWTWYSLTNYINISDTAGHHLNEQTSTDLEVVFDKPTSTGQILLLFSGAGFPQYEIKQQDSRHVFAVIRGGIPTGVLTVKVLPP